MNYTYPSNQTHRLNKEIDRIETLFSTVQAEDGVENRREVAAARREELLAQTGGGEKVCMICMTPRSGSTFFSEALKATNLLGNPGEWFNAHGDKNIQQMIERYDCRSRTDLLDGIYNFSATDNGVAIIKGDYFQCLPFLYDNLLMKHYREVHFVSLTREDLLAQGISRYIGTVTGKWSSTQKSSGKKPDYDRGQIAQQIQFLADMEASWEFFYATRGIKPLRMTYEQLSRNLSRQILRVSDLLNVDLKIDVAPDDLKLQKQGSTLNREWAKRFAMETGQETAQMDYPVVAGNMAEQEQAK